jgi:AraC family transcriptional regulator of adaptative response/methylated-DNA-[protein]-cysteine methyltransferase
MQSELQELTELLDRPVVEGSGDAPGLRHLAQMEGELRRYFAGTLRSFETPLLTRAQSSSGQSGRNFSASLSDTPAPTARWPRSSGKPGAARAVGRANGRNRIAIVIPCHRVIEANGKLRGYGGGLERKRFLLDHERQLAGDAGFLFR